MANSVEKKTKASAAGRTKLVIVESPKKIKPIKEYLGRGYEVVASNGHVRDLPKSSLGVDTEHGFAPKYITQRGKSDVIKNLKDAAKNASFIYLATDPDREGEAISWHLAHLLDLDLSQKNRITFSEITKTGIKQGISQPRSIDLKLVDAQQTRRVMDRLVGYKMSPFLWKKVRTGLSAGRVQSVVVRLIVDREDEIDAFVPQEFWTIDAQLRREGDKKAFASKLALVNGKKAAPKTKEEADAILNEIRGKDFVVSSVKTAKKRKNPLPPFITSTLQQEASKRLGFVSKKTMNLAQELYEGITLENGSTVGLITYMRTDSLRLSKEATDAARAHIMEAYGPAYLPAKENVYANKNTAQDAHEAIRPSTPSLTPAKVKTSLTKDQYRLYKLVWERFMACQMTPAVYQTVTAEIGVGDCTFRSAGQTPEFDGFEILYADKSDEVESALPELQEGEKLLCDKLDGNQHFTQPPARYNEASIIKAMEEYGIGRPSTYATVIATILARDYVEREGKTLVPTPLGRIVTEQIANHFEKIVDVQFTAHMEKQLDRVEQGERVYGEVLDEFYSDFKKSLDAAMETIGEEKVALPVEESDVVCEKCGRKMVYKNGRFGRFLACPGFPSCRNTKTIVVEAAGSCPVCGSKMSQRKTKKGRIFYSCTNYPACNFMSWDEPIAETCEKCGKHLFEKKGKNPRIYCAKEGCGYERGVKE